VDLQRYASATLVVGDAEGFGYEATVDVRDGDGDGRVTVLFNTSNAGASEAAAQEVENEEVYLARGSEDDVRLTDETALPGGLAAADYPVDATLNGTAEAAATLVVEPRETVGLRAYTAPREADLENRSTVVAAASPSDTVAVGDYLVAEVTVTGVYGYVTETADLSENGIEVTINQTDVAQNTEAKRLDTADAELFRDPDNDTLYLTKRLLAREVEPDEEYEVEFSVTDENRFVPDGEGEAVSDRVRVTDQSVTVDRNLDEGLVLEPIRGATVTGESTLAPGTELWARMRSEGAETGFYQQRTVEVSPNGTVTIRFDTRAVPLTADLVLTVGRGQTTFDTVEVGLSNDPVSTPTPRPPGGVETPTTPTPPPSPTPIPSPTPTPTPSPTPSPSPTPTPTPAPSPTDSGPDAGGSPPDGTAAVDGGTGEDGGDGGGGTAGAGGGSTDPAGVFVGAFLAVVAFAAVLAVGVTWGRRE
jgi:hypothetical protein